MNEYYNKLSVEYDSLYIQNIIDFQNSMRERKNKNAYFVDFYPSFGTKNNERLNFLVIGQAVNGWTSGFHLFDEIDNLKLLDSILSSNKYLKTKNFTPLDWVNVQWSRSIYNKHSKDNEIKNFYDGRYQPYKSLFWNITYKLISDYYSYDRDSFDWSKKLVWSNLYKIAPDGSNPDIFCKSIQSQLSIELIKKEIQELNPKYCIVLTNLNWWLPFRKGLQTKVMDFDRSFNKIESLEYYNDTKIIITKRPMFASSENFVKQILKLIEA